jgi:hypothetical protein
MDIIHEITKLHFIPSFLSLFDSVLWYSSQLGSPFLSCLGLGIWSVPGLILLFVDNPRAYLIRSCSACLYLSLLAAIFLLFILFCCLWAFALQTSLQYILYPCLYCRNTFLHCGQIFIMLRLGLYLIFLCFPHLGILIVN